MLDKKKWQMFSMHRYCEVAKLYIEMQIHSGWSGTRCIMKKTVLHRRAPQFCALGHQINVASKK